MDENDISRMASSLPAPKGGGGLPFKRGVINPWRVIGDFELFLFTGGDARMSVDEMDYPCPDGSYLLMRPALRHLSLCLSEKVFVRWMHFDWTPGRAASGTVYVKGPFAPFPSFSFERPSFFKSGIAWGRVQGESALELHDRACSRLALGTPQARRVARAVFLEELLELLGEPEPGSEQGARPDERLAYEAMKLLRKLAASPQRDDPPMKSSLSSLGRSYEHVERCFKRRFGESPESHLAGLRMERAKALLLESSLNVSEIAEALGYDDPGYFSRLFSRRLGVSPGRFRGERKPFSP